MVVRFELDGTTRRVDAAPFSPAYHVLRELGLWIPEGGRGLLWSKKSLYSSKTLPFYSLEGKKLWSHEGLLAQKGWADEALRIIQDKHFFCPVCLADRLVALLAFSEMAPPTFEKLIALNKELWLASADHMCSTVSAFSFLTRHLFLYKYMALEHPKEGSGV